MTTSLYRDKLPIGTLVIRRNLIDQIAFLDFVCGYKFEEFQDIGDDKPRKHLLMQIREFQYGRSGKFLRKKTRWCSWNFFHSDFRCQFQYPKGCL